MKHFYIVTPVRNGARWIDGAINGIVSQAGEIAIHYHVQDGGSTDGTIEKITRWEKLLHGDNPVVQCARLHFSWDSEADSGMYEALNKAFAKLDVPADGIMSWLNADDVYFPGVFSCLAKAFSDIPEMSFLVGNWRFFENTGALYFHQSHQGPYPQEIMREYCCDGRLWSALPQPSVFWTGALWSKGGPLNDALRYAGDFDLWGRFAHHAECMYLPLVLSACTRHEGQLGKARPWPASPQTYYDMERDYVRPFEERLAFMRQFWKKRFLPPKGAMLRLEKGRYVVERVQCWPFKWGKTTAEYFWRRLSWWPRCVSRYIGLFP